MERRVGPRWAAGALRPVRADVEEIEPEPQGQPAADAEPEPELAEDNVDGRRVAAFVERRAKAQHR